MANDLIYFYDHTTEEIILREMSDEEQTQRNNEIDDWKTAKEAKIKANAEAKAIAEAKLAVIGLTADDLKALGLG